MRTHGTPCTGLPCCSILQQKPKNKARFSHHLFFPTPSSFSRTDGRSLLTPFPPKPGAGEGETRKGASPPWEPRPEAPAPAPATAHGQTGAAQTTREHVSWKTIHKAAGCWHCGISEWKGWGALARAPQAPLPRDRSRAASPLAPGKPPPRVGRSPCLPVSLRAGSLPLAGAEAGLSDDTAPRRAGLVPLPRAGKPSVLSFIPNVVPEPLPAAEKPCCREQRSSGAPRPPESTTLPLEQTCRPAHREGLHGPAPSAAGLWGFGQRPPQGLWVRCTRRRAVSGWVTLGPRCSLQQARAQACPPVTLTPAPVTELRPDTPPPHCSHSTPASFTNSPSTRRPEGPSKMQSACSSL